MRSFRRDVSFASCHLGRRYRTIGRSPLECVHASDNVRASRAGLSCPKTRPPPTRAQNPRRGFQVESPDGPRPHSGGDDRSGSWKILESVLQSAFARNLYRRRPNGSLGLHVRKHSRFVFEPRENCGISVSAEQDPSD